MRSNWLDRAIGFVAPGVALSRVKARAQTAMLERAYAGASKGRVSGGWVAASTSPDSEVATAQPLLRARMRDLVRNNPHAAKAVASWTNNIVGNGIVGRPVLANEQQDKKATEAWAKWCKKCDHDGLMDFYGLQTLAVRIMIESGEVLIRRKWRRATDRVPGNMQIQVIEPDLLDSSRNNYITATGGYTIQGVEFDKQHRRVAYWLWPVHPGSIVAVSKNNLVSVRVPAEDVIHMYDRTRTQVRGVPWGSPSMVAMKDYGDYTEAEQLRKKIEACMVGIVTGGDEGDMGVGIPVADSEFAGVYDSAGQPVERFEPGMFAHARGGRDIKFNQPAATGNYEQFSRVTLHAIAAGFRIPYELLTGELSQVNYSSIRAGLTEFRRLVMAAQSQIVIAMMLDRVGEWFAEAHYLAGLIDTLDVPFVWTPPKFYSVDPLKDVMADLLEVRSGMASLSQKIAERGGDAKELLAEIKATASLIDSLELVFDSDPRQTAKNGALQININAGDGNPDKPPVG